MTATMKFVLLSALLSSSYAWVVGPIQNQHRTTAPAIEHVLVAPQQMSTIAVEEDKTSTTVSIPKPEIIWTVPSMKRGWQDDDGTWWDEDGIRNGPPMNYWRQRADEREHAKNMAALDEVLSGRKLDTSQLSSMRMPFRNRKLLGVWAPVIHKGEQVANVMPDGDGSLSVPYTISISRKFDRKLGSTTGYGTFDAHMDEGESLTVTVGDESYTVFANEANDVQSVSSDGNAALSIGNISYLSDYLCIMKDDTGDDQIVEFWARAEANVSIPKDEVARLRALEPQKEETE